jgi:ribosome maturation factor RimP
MKNESVIKNLIEKPLLDINIRIDDISYVKENNMNILRITIDKEPYIDVDDCVAATKIINPIIDKEDIINDTYILDVCSKEKGVNK